MQITTGIQPVDLSAIAERRFEAAAAAVGAVEVVPSADELRKLAQRTREALEQLEDALLPPIINDRLAS